MPAGPAAGCHEVPDPIAPIDIRLCALEPTRMLMPSSDITISPSPSAVFDSAAPAVVCPACDSPGVGDGEGVGEGEGAGVLLAAGGLCASCPWCCARAFAPAGTSRGVSATAKSADRTPPLKVPSPF